MYDTTLIQIDYSSLNESFLNFDSVKHLFEKNTFHSPIIIRILMIIDVYVVLSRKYDT